jgi:N-(2-amino-2-carboxyethyl)-L-glutamate synthase
MRDGILETIGNTPLIRLTAALAPCRFDFYAKWEAPNPGGSIKDRAAVCILRRAIEDGLVGRETTVIESSSGNMGIGLAMACASLRLPFICVVDAKTTAQNLAILRAYGAQVEIVTVPDEATGEYLPARIRRVEAIVRSRSDVFWTRQYANHDNALAHYDTMREIVRDLGKPPDYVFCATSTCGTLRGCSEYARQQQLPTQLVAVDAVGSVIFNSPKARRLLPGMGAACVPELFSADLAARCVHVTDWDCITGCRHLVRTEAILAGGSSGGVVAAVERDKARLGDGAAVVAILCDRGDRYLDTVYSDEWVSAHYGAAATHLFEETTACLTTF